MRNDGPILVALDGSEVAEGAVPCAIAIADALRADLAFVNVWEGPTGDIRSLPIETLPQLEADGRRACASYLEGIRSRLGRKSIRLTVVAGFADREIVKAADEIGARAIAIATHGRSGVTRWWYGSTASHLLRSSRQPIVAVGPHALRPISDKLMIKRVLVPLDGSPKAEEALSPARRLAEALGATLILARCVAPAGQAYPILAAGGYLPAMDHEIEEGAKAYLRGVATRVAANAEDAFVLRGSSADALIQFVETQNIDLVVMTTHARAGLARGVLGSTADRMLQCAAPVMLLRPEEHSREGESGATSSEGPAARS